MRQGHTPEWYATWFSTKYYDRLYGHRDMQEAAHFVQNLLAYLHPAPGARFLDAACGKGRHATLLAEQGFDVTGIDLSFRNIREAIAVSGERVSFFQHDMRRVFRVNYFDVIFNFYTSFGYFEDPNDDLRCLRAFAAGLKPGGRLMIDFLNMEYARRHLVEDESKVIDDTEFTITKSFEDGFLQKHIEIRCPEGRHTITEKVRALDKTDLEALMAAAGMQTVDVFGDYDLAPFDLSTSERLILIAQKP